MCNTIFDNLLKSTVPLSQEHMDYLRTCVKYLRFDLEATRRERDAARKLLHDTSDSQDLSDPPHHE